MCDGWYRIGLQLAAMRKYISSWKKTLRNVLLTQHCGPVDNILELQGTLRQKFQMNYYFCLSSCDGAISPRRTVSLYCTSLQRAPIASSMVFSVSGSRDSLRYCFITKKPIHMKLGTPQQIILHKLCAKFQTSSSTHLKNITI